ncbi:hypothetical protein CDO81_15270 [Roseateles puraquae]|uniref:Uncharacterized protein n=1 Tax=Roseateles puraquae TaxID=431059 RepID=A0A254N4E3_9BURK|nr:hypothetical protein CDO81_15270 [Roseateles puraquae]
MTQLDGVEAQREVSRYRLGGDQSLVLRKQFRRRDASALQQAESLRRDQYGSRVEGGRIGFVHLNVPFGGAHARGSPEAVMGVKWVGVKASERLPTGQPRTLQYS